MNDKGVNIWGAKGLLNLLKKGGIDLNKYNLIVFDVCNLGMGIIPQDFANLSGIKTLASPDTVIFGLKDVSLNGFYVKHKNEDTNQVIVFGTSPLSDTASEFELRSTLRNLWNLYKPIK